MTEQGRSTELEDAGLPLTALAVPAGRAVETSRPTRWWRIDSLQPW
ncbi:hypothetical protein [Arthrobacter sp. ZGTC131]|nr:hypothetical protein [Arthrobacter sp. ZGTC131]